MKIKRLLICLFSIFIFLGCSSNRDKVSENFNRTNDIFEIYGSDYRVNVDKKTDNVYLTNTIDTSITPLYNKDGKISKFSIEASNLTTFDVNKYRFYKTDELYKIDNSNYRIVVDTETDNCYLVNTHKSTICPLYDKDGNITKYSSYKKMDIITNN